MRDQLSFMRQWCAAPLQVASIMPSSRSLSRMMTKGLNVASRPILVLGAGTGVFIRALLERGVQEENIAVVEMNQDFADTLSKRYPRAQVHCISATNIANRAFFDSDLAVVVSGLGLLAMPKPSVEAILHGAFKHLKHGGAFVQFTYGLGCPLSKELLLKLGLDAEHLGVNLRNFPPASVYRITRRHFD